MGGRNWHKCEVPTASRNVWCWGKSGKHLLARSISHFDPTATLAPSKIFRRIGPPEVFQISSLDGYTGAF